MGIWHSPPQVTTVTNRTQHTSSIPSTFDTKLVYPMPSFIGTRLLPQDYKDVKLVETPENVSLTNEAIKLLLKSANRTKAMPQSENTLMVKVTDADEIDEKGTYFTQMEEGPVGYTKFNAAHEASRDTQVRNINSQFEASIPQVHPETGRKLLRSIPLDLCTDYQQGGLELTVLLKEQRRLAESYIIDASDELDTQSLKILLTKHLKTETSRKNKGKTGSVSQPQSERKSPRSLSRKGKSSAHGTQETSDSHDGFETSGEEDNTQFKKEKTGSPSSGGSEQRGKKTDGVGEENTQVSDDVSQPGDDEEMDVTKPDVTLGEFKIISAFLKDNIEDNRRKCALYIPTDTTGDEHAKLLPITNMMRARDSVPLLNGKLKIGDDIIYNVTKPLIAEYVEKGEESDSEGSGVFGGGDSDSDDDLRKAKSGNESMSSGSDTESSNSSDRYSRKKSRR